MSRVRERVRAAVRCSAALGSSTDPTDPDSLIAEIRGQRDQMIAATALEHGLTLVANNPADYSDLPDLLVETPPTLQNR